MSRALRVLSRLLFWRPLIPVLLALVYLVAALVFLTVEPDKRGLAIAVLSAFAAGGLAAVLTERAARFSRDAGALGLPDHARTLRLAQGWFLALFVGLPAVIASVLGVSPLASLAILTAAAAFGVVLATWGGWLFIVMPVAGRLLPIGHWAMLPAVQACAVIAGGALLTQWLSLPARAETYGRYGPLLLSDARHERVAGSRSSAPAPEASEQRKSAGRRAVPAPEIGPGADTADVPRLLASAFGYAVGTAWRRSLQAAVAVILMLALWHAVHGSYPRQTGYLVMTAACCFMMVARLQRLLQRWISTSLEQSLLLLTPHWPGAGAIKRALIISTLMVQRGPWLVWISSSLLAMALGWIERRFVLASALALTATSLAFSAAACAVLAHRRIREWHLSTLTLVGSVGIGAVTIVLGFMQSDATGSGRELACGVMLMLIPPALGMAWYALAPLRLPLQVDPRAMQALRVR